MHLVGDLSQHAVVGNGIVAAVVGLVKKGVRLATDPAHDGRNGLHVCTADGVWACMLVMGGGGCGHGDVWTQGGQGGWTGEEGGARTEVGG